MLLDRKDALCDDQKLEGLVSSTELWGRSRSTCRHFCCRCFVVFIISVAVKERFGGGGVDGLRHSWRKSRLPARLRIAPQNLVSHFVHRSKSD